MDAAAASTARERDPGTAPDCDDMDVCTADACAEPGGCANTAIADCCNVDTDCDDGDDCTTDTCAGNACGNEPIPGCVMGDAGPPEGDAGMTGDEDAGMTGDEDAGTGGADAGRRPTGPRDDGGCGCSVPAPQPRLPLLLVLGAAIAGLALRRRRR